MGKWIVVRLRFIHRRRGEFNEYQSEKRLPGGRSFLHMLRYSTRSIHETEFQTRNGTLGDARMEGFGRASRRS